MGKVALITGASKGIGKELAFIFAAEGCELVLVARSGDRLHQLKTELESLYGVIVNSMVLDLSRVDAAQELFNMVKAKGLDVDYLVNNAGFGDYGLFSDTDWSCYEEMINLNVTTLTHLTHLYVNDWKEKQVGGRILNVSSLAAFQPGPMMAIYFASKAFVLHLSEAIGNELKNKGITVTALCPGPTHTHFGEVSKMNASQLVKNVKIADARKVAETGFKAMMRGKSVVIHGGANKLVPFFIRFLPRKWVVLLSGMIMRQ